MHTHPTRRRTLAAIAVALTLAIAGAATPDAGASSLRSSSPSVAAPGASSAAVVPRDRAATVYDFTPPAPVERKDNGPLGSLRRATQHPGDWLTLFLVAFVPLILGIGLLSALTGSRSDD